MKATPVEKNLIKEYNLDIGKFTFYPNIIVCEINEGVHISFENAAFPIQIAEMVFGSEKPIVYISHRVNSYSWNPMHYQEVIDLFPNFSGFAIVSKNKRRKMIAHLENLFIKKPIQVFDNLDDAIDWAHGIIASHE